MILFLGMPRLVAIAHAVIAGTCDVSPRTASQSTLKSLSRSVSNAVGNERSESMREMCGCVSFSVRPNAQVYAPRSSWNVQETSSQTSPPSLSSPLLLFLSHYYSFFISLLLVFMFSDCALSFHRPQAGLLDRNKRLMCLFMWLPTSQNKILAKEKLGTMETA